MDTSVIPDNLGDDDAPASTGTRDDRRPEPTQRPHRHFAFDPASSPLVTTALAWTDAAAR